MDTIDVEEQKSPDVVVIGASDPGLTALKTIVSSSNKASALTTLITMASINPMINELGMGFNAPIRRLLTGEVKTKKCALKICGKLHHKRGPCCSVEHFYALKRSLK